MSTSDATNINPVTLESKRRRSHARLLPHLIQDIHPVVTARIPANRTAALLSAMIAVVAIGWIGVIFAVESARFVVFEPAAKAGVEVILALTSLFGALVLFLFPDEGARQRLRWVASGFLLLGFGGLVFGYLQPLLHESRDLNVSMYTALLLRGLAGLLFAVGLLPRVPRRFTPSVLMVVGGIFFVLVVMVSVMAGALPTLARVENLEAIALRDTAMLSGLTTWNWAFASIPLALIVAAAIGAIWRYPGNALGGWLAIAMALMASAQLHALFWPSAFSPLLTTASLLRLCFTIVVVAGATLELRAIARERALMLATEQEYSRRLGDLASLRADFTAMVAHELTTPLAAIRRYSDVLALGDLSPQQRRAVDAVQSEINVLSSLIADVHSIASVERDDFAIHPRPVSISSLMDDAAAFARSLPGNHPVKTVIAREEQVLADPERIGQVLRNLLSNAAKYSSKGAPIELRALLMNNCVRIEVVDQGYGIHPEDLTRIFGKFERGRDVQRRQVAGVGVGLYLSQRITQAHGSQLSVASTYGVGSTFAFSLNLIR